MIPRTLRSPAFLVALGILITSSMAMSAAISYFKIYLKKEPIQARDGRQLLAIPSESKSFIRVGADARMEKDVEVVLGTQNYLPRHYREKVGSEGYEPRLIQFHAAYYTGMIDTVPHVPDRCMVGAGMLLKNVVGDLPLPFDKSRWELDEYVPDRLKGRIYRVKTSDPPADLPKETARAYGDAPNTPFRLPLDPDKIKLRTMVFEDQQGRQRYAGYFFIANGGTVSRAEEVRLLAFDLKSTYAYYLKVEFQSESVKSAEELVQLAAKFLDENFAEIMRCSPDWVEVELGEYPPDNPIKAQREIEAAKKRASISGGVPSSGSKFDEAKK